MKHQAYYATGYELPWGHPETFQYGKEKKIKLEGSRAAGIFLKYSVIHYSRKCLRMRCADLKEYCDFQENGRNIFGTPQKAMGKTIRYENSQDFVVVDVVDGGGLRISVRANGRDRHDVLTPQNLEDSRPECFIHTREGLVQMTLTSSS